MDIQHKSLSATAILSLIRLLACVGAWAYNINLNLYPKTERKCDFWDFFAADSYLVRNLLAHK